MSVLVDTNVLLRRTQPDHPSHAVAVESVARLLAAGERVCFTPQNIAEFWNVATCGYPHMIEARPDASVNVSGRSG